jgi:hypothetical protein
VHLIPARLGRNDALDAAVHCLCSAYIGFLSSNTKAETTLYPRALLSLRQYLSREDTLLSSEVLCAVVCLSWYEVGSDGHKAVITPADRAAGPAQ